jgi:uncharacterized delta-60 repeat protein
MKIIKSENNGRTDILKGVSTLDSQIMRITLLFLVITVFGGSVYAGHSILDRVDPAFNPEIQSDAYGGKIVHQVEALPDGKTLVLGYFSSYNRMPVGRVVRLNADGSLDSTFNYQTITSTYDSGGRTKIVPLPDGKILVAAQNIVTDGQAPKTMVRLNSDGTLDTSFNFALDSLVYGITIDSLGRVVAAGNFAAPQGTRYLVRLNNDGSLDNSFNFTNGITGSEVGPIAAQGIKVIIGGSNGKIYRINENGSEDASFTPLLTTGLGVYGVAVQPDNKILYSMDRIRRLNENGGVDESFQPANGMGRDFKLAGDGRIVALSDSSPNTFRRFLPNGAIDPSFNQYAATSNYCYTVQSGGGIVIGDQSNLNNSTVSVNNFVRLTPEGTPDPAFNPGGVGFQNILPGSIRAIEAQPDGKTLLGGKFDVINDVARIKLARLNADSTVDPSFQINTSGTGNYFLIIRDVYQIRVQSNGKIVVSGSFDYFLGGVAKRNLVRLNSDGSMDTTFNLAHSMPDYSEIVGAGRNRFLILNDGGLMVGISKLNGLGQPGPLKLMANGAIDTSFNSTLNLQSSQMYIDDLAIQPDGKVLVVGSHNSTQPMVSFIARLNADGTMDTTFHYTEEPGRLRAALALLPDGKILAAKHSDGTGPGRVERLNPDGSPDTSFNPLSLTAGIINALLVLPDGNIFVGGKFTTTVFGQPDKNLLRLDSDGNSETTAYNLDSEVLSLALDGEGRLLVGGSFTVIGANGSGATRSYVARLTDSHTQFDFDGDGKADISIFRPSEGNWHLSRSQSGFSLQNFGIPGDVITPGDFDGDGKTDLAIFRPSTGTWWYKSTVNGAFYPVQFGAGGDIPLAEDFNGDGRADFVIFRPSTSSWYRLGSNGEYASINFGTPGDIPLVADMDGDGKADPTVYRPSTGTWWYASSINGLFYAVQWGTAEDIPVPGDYDGDGISDPAYFRPSTGAWFILYSGAKYTTFLVKSWGVAGDRPTPADYDGDGKTDLAIYRPSNGMWFAMRSTSGFFSQQFGLSGDKAAPNAFLP